MLTAARFGHQDPPPAAPQAVSAVVPAVERDQTLLLAQTGDQTAFAALIRRHQNMVFSLALHVMRGREAAEDMAQEVFLEFYRSLGRIESDAHAISWLRRVTMHRCIDEIRRRQHRPETTVETMPDPGAAPRPREVFLEGRLQQLVAELPENARAVMVLRYQEELEPMEIAETLGMSINTVKSHLRRSLAALRDSLHAGRNQ